MIRGASHEAGAAPTVSAAAAANATTTRPRPGSAAAASSGSSGASATARSASAGASANSRPTTAAAPVPAPSRSAAYSAGMRSRCAMKASPKPLAAQKNGSDSSRYSADSRGSWPRSHTSSRPLNGIRCASAKPCTAVTPNSATAAAKTGVNARASGAPASASSVPAAPCPSRARLMIIAAKGCHWTIARSRNSSSS